MLALLADENLNRHIVRGLFLRKPGIDLVRVQEVGLQGADDPTVLSWAAREERAVLSHDVQTMLAYARARIEAGLRMPGLFEVRLDAPLSRVIEDILLLVECSADGEWEGRWAFLPL